VKDSPVCASVESPFSLHKHKHTADRACSLAASALHHTAPRHVKTYASPYLVLWHHAVVHLKKLLGSSPVEVQGTHSTDFIRLTEKLVDDEPCVHAVSRGEW